MVSTFHEVMDLLELISYVRKMRKEGYDRYLLIPIKKSDKVLVRTWNHERAVASYQKRRKDKK